LRVIGTRTGPFAYIEASKLTDRRSIEENSVSVAVCRSLEGDSKYSVAKK
jgi:hypothetical protein